MSRPLGRLPRASSEPLSGTQARAFPPSTGSGPGRLQVSWLDKPVLEPRTAGGTWRGLKLVGPPPGMDQVPRKTGDQSGKPGDPRKGRGGGPYPTPSRAPALKRARCSFRESKPPCACLQFSLKLLDCEDLVIRQSFLLYKVVLFRI